MTKVKVEVNNLMEKEVLNISALKRKIAKQINMKYNVTEKLLKKSRVIGMIVPEAIEHGSEKVILCQDIYNENFFFVRDQKEIRDYIETVMYINIPQVFIV